MMGFSKRTRTPEQQATFDKIVKTMRDALRVRFGDAVKIPEHDDAQVNVGKFEDGVITVQPSNYLYGGPMPGAICVSYEAQKRRTTNYAIDKDGTFNVQKMVARVAAGLEEVKAYRAEQQARKASSDAVRHQRELGEAEIIAFNDAKKTNIDKVPVWTLQRWGERDGKGVYNCDLKFHDITLDEIHQLVTLANSFKRGG